MSNPSQPTPSTIAAPGQPRELLGGDGPHPEDCFWVCNDRGNFMSQVEHRDCCRSHEERDLLLIGNEKLTASVGSSYDLYWTNQIKRHKYDSLVSILACSHYYRREDAIRCGYLSFACHDTLFCPRCCYRRLAWPLLDEYGSGFCAENEVWFVVVSLSSNPDETLGVAC